MSLVNGRIEEPVRVIGPLLVCSLWAWAAVRTAQCLRLITRSTIPFTKRTIWLMKILALIVGAGGIGSALADFGVPWFLAVVPAGIIVFFSLAEKITEVVPPKPIQDPSVYQSAWREHWRLHTAYKRSALGFGSTLLLIMLTSFFGVRLPEFAQIVLFAVCIVAFIVFIVSMSFNRWKWLYWPCPRCGHSFQGAWARLWLPKHCVYCGLPRQGKDFGDNSS